MEKILVFSGAGISAESGLKTFRDSGGLWENYQISEVASPAGWKKTPELLLDFYNQRREQAYKAKPNKAHRMLAKLQEKFAVTVVTQNVDNLHERAGSKNVIHLHGRLNQARSSIDASLVYDIGNKPILIGDKCEKNSQLRPNIVWFGEQVENLDLSARYMNEANKVLVIGTSLTVYPAASLLQYAKADIEKLIVNLDMEDVPDGFTLISSCATQAVPLIVDRWLDDAGKTS